MRIRGGNQCGLEACITTGDTIITANASMHNANIGFLLILLSPIVFLAVNAGQSRVLFFPFIFGLGISIIAPLLGALKST